MGSLPEVDERPTFFFDIDDCLYSKDKGVDSMMYTKTEQFMVNSLQMSPEQAALLHREYLREFGSTIEGLIHHHQVDPLSFNKQVDDALPLEDLLEEDVELQHTLARFNSKKVKLWLLTNAHITHARRVVRILGIEKYFEGITFCDYASGKLILKPDEKMYAVAELDAGVGDVRQCFFVDNSVQNCIAAQRRGWTAVHLSEYPQGNSADEKVRYQVRILRELSDLFPRFT